MPGKKFRVGQAPLSNGHLAFHRSGGDKPTLLFIHGLGDNGRCWLRVAQALQDDYDIILLDSRGHGGSAMPPEGHMDDPASDLRRLLDHLLIDQVFVVGHSIGALSAAAFTASNNQRVIKLVLEDPPFRDSPFQVSKKMLDGFSAQMNKFREMSHSDVIAFGRNQHPLWDLAEFDAWATAKRQVNPAILDRYAFSSWQELIAQISVPSLLLRGEPDSDSVVSTQCAHAVQALNKHFSDVVISGTGHNVRRENFKEYVASLSAFLDQ